MLIVIGILAGLIHVFAGPDHLAAIAPLALKRQRGAWRTGLRWGAGHAAGVGVVGLLSLLLRGLLPVDMISSWSDRLIGVLLIGIGFWTLRKALQIHSHEHEHDGETHSHVHIHGARPTAGHSSSRSHLHTHAAFGIGTLHGLAGSSHFLAVIPSLALPTNFLAVVYLSSYGVGTVLAMILFASIINLFSLRFARVANIYRGVLFTCSAVAFAVGCCWLAGFSF